MKCHFCGKLAPVGRNMLHVTSQMCDDGWATDYWDGNEDIDEFVCPECCEERLRFNAEDGGFELKDLPLQPMTMEEY